MGLFKNIDISIFLVPPVSPVLNWLDWNGTGKVETMNYKINDICNSLNIGKSTIYKRIDIIKNIVPETEWKKNEYFYYTENNKLFITEKGFEFIRDNKTKKENNTYKQSVENDIAIYQNQIIEIYKQRIEYLENENKRLLDIISVKEQKELAKDMKYIGNNETTSFWDKFFNKFKK